MRIDTQTDPALRQQEESCAIVPVGSIEQHGPHLPVSTDSDLVTAVAERVGSGDNFLVTPTITTGVSFEHAPFFNISIRASTLSLILQDVCDSLYSNGIKYVFVINGHYGNKKALEGFVKERQGNKPVVRVFSYWEFTGRRFDHAGFMETSLMLAVSDRVIMSKAQKGLDTSNMTDEEITNIKKISLESFPKATGNGIWGDPRKATADEGRSMLNEIVQNMQRELQSQMRNFKNSPQC